MFNGKRRYCYENGELAQAEPARDIKRLIHLGLLVGDRDAARAGADLGDPILYGLSAELDRDAALADAISPTTNVYTVDFPRETNFVRGSLYPVA